MQTEVIQINPLEPEPQKVKKAADAIKNARLVVIPTETVYGIAANMLDEKAVERLYSVKQRPKDKPFTLHIADKGEVEKYAQELLPFAYRLIEKFWPGPMTLILKSKDNRTIGIRMPNHKVALSILKEAAVPVVCPSANISGGIAPVSALEPIKDLEGLVDLVVDSGKTTLGKESTIVDVTQLPIKILRQGALSEEAIEREVNRKTVLFVCTGNSCRSVMAKALLEKKLKEIKRDNVEVFSAGTMMLEGLGATEETKELLRREGIEVCGHHSQKLSAEMIKRADIILVMEKLHEGKALQLAPSAKNRLFLLKEFAKIEDNHLDINDPIGRPMDFYEKIFNVIREAIERIARVI